MKLRKETELLTRIRSILFWDWDPIGVNHVPEANDEYDSYAHGVLRLLVADASEERLAKHLHRLETGSMGLPSITDAEHRKTAVRKLLELKNEQI